MKHLIQILNLKITFFVVFITAALAGTSNLNAQVFDTIPSILFENQAQIDSFPYYYPFENIVVDGDVRFKDGEEFNNTDSLYNIHSITGRFLGNAYYDPLEDQLVITTFTNRISLPKLEYVNEFLPPLGQYSLTLPNLKEANTIELGKLTWDAGKIYEILGVTLNYFGAANLEKVDNFLCLELNLLGSGHLNLTSLNNAVELLRLRQTNVTNIKFKDSQEFEFIELIGNQFLSNCNNIAFCNHANLDRPMYLSGNFGGCNSVSEIVGLCNNLLCPPDSILHFQCQSEVDNFLIAYPDCTELKTVYLYSDYCSTDSITNLNGFVNIVKVTGDISIAFTNCVNLYGLHNLKSVNNLSIYGCNRLQSIELNDSLQIEESLSIQYTSLSECSETPICNHLSDLNSISFSNNELGCNSVDEVRENCLTALEKFDDKNQFSIYPNPSKDVIKIQSTNFPYELEIIDMHGSILYTEKEISMTLHAIDISDLPGAIYFVRVKETSSVKVHQIQIVR